MWHQITSYLSFIRSATNHHGVHSPFVYELVTQCFYNKTRYNSYKELSKYRDYLYQSKEVINVTDFGAGSRVFSSNKRPVAAIAKNAGISTKRQRLLYRIAQYLKPGAILELGTSLGLGTMALALGNPKSNVVTVEGCPEISKIATHGFKKFKLSNITHRNLSFQEFFKNNDTTFDLVYIDGHHDGKRTLDYFEHVLATAKPTSVFIFDDIYWSSSMTQAWKQIYQHPKVTVSIDTFYWGVIFFRKEQQKQHFKIRL